MKNLILFYLKVYHECQVTITGICRATQCETGRIEKHSKTSEPCSVTRMEHWMLFFLCVCLFLLVLRSMEQVRLTKMSSIFPAEESLHNCMRQTGETGVEGEAGEDKNKADLLHTVRM